jgi:NAD(P)-dependent dehydrogenase (short-subunit alcohol dehydrogenase family)
MVSVTDLSGQTVLVTGATSGLGYAVSLQLLFLKPKLLIIGVRSLERGETARREFLADPKVKAAHPAAAVKVMELDVGNYASVVSFGAALKSQHNLLHMVLLNAAAVPGAFELGPDGHETAVQNIFLSNALLAVEVLPLLEAGSKATGVSSKLTLVSSQMQRLNTFGKTPVKPNGSLLAHMDDPENYGNVARYGDAKFLVTVFVKDLSKRVDASSVTINFVCPGMIKTNLGRDAPFLLKTMSRVLQAVLARTPEVGAKNYMHALLSDESSHGKFITASLANTLSNDTPLSPITTTEEGVRLEAMIWNEAKEEFLKADPALQSTYLTLEQGK